MIPNNDINPKIKPKYMLTSFLIFMSLLSFIYIINFNANDEYTFLWTLPAVFFICVLLFFPIITKIRTLGLYVFILIENIRYVVIPAMMCISGWYRGLPFSSAPSSKAINTAFEIMVVTLVAEFIIIAICTKYLNKTAAIQKLMKEGTNQYKLLNIIVPLLMLVFLFLVNKYSFNRFQFFGFYFFQNRESYFVFGEAFAESCKFIILVSLMVHNIEQYNKKKSLINIVWVILFYVLNIAIYTGENRIKIFFMAIVGLAIIIKYMSMRKQSIYATILVGIAILVIGFTTMTSNKNYYNYPNILAEQTVYIQLYTGGHYNVAVSVDMTNHFSSQITAKTFLTDLTADFVLLGNLVKEFYPPVGGTRYLFAETLNRYFDPKPSQIVPAVGQGYAYWGLWGSPIISCFFLLLMMFYEKKFLYSKIIIYDSVRILTILVLAMVNCYNLSIEIMFITGFIIPANIILNTTFFLKNFFKEGLR